MAANTLLPVFGRMLLASGQCDSDHIILGENLFSWLLSSGCCPDETEAESVSQALLSTGVISPQGGYSSAFNRAKSYQVHEKPMKSSTDDDVHVQRLSRAFSRSSFATGDQGRDSFGSFLGSFSGIRDGPVRDSVTDMIMAAMPVSHRHSESSPLKVIRENSESGNGRSTLVKSPSSSATLLPTSLTQFNDSELRGTSGYTPSTVSAALVASMSNVSSALSLNVSIISAENRTDAAGSVYTSFCIKVVLAGTSSDPWTISRRYSQFDELHRSISKRIGSAMNFSFPEVLTPGMDVGTLVTEGSKAIMAQSSNQPLPELPGKSLGKATMSVLGVAPSKSFVEERRVKLENYLRELVKVAAVWQCEEFISFLDNDTHTLASQCNYLRMLAAMRMQTYISVSNIQRTRGIERKVNSTNQAIAGLTNKVDRLEALLREVALGNRGGTTDSEDTDSSISRKATKNLNTLNSLNSTGSPLQSGSAPSGGIISDYFASSKDSNQSNSPHARSLSGSASRSLSGEQLAVRIPTTPTRNSATFSSLDALVLDGNALTSGPDSKKSSDIENTAKTYVKQFTREADAADVPASLNLNSVPLLSELESQVRNSKILLCSEIRTAEDVKSLLDWVFGTSSDSLSIQSSINPNGIIDPNDEITLEALDAFRQTIHERNCKQAYFLGLLSPPDSQSSQQSHMNGRINSNGVFEQDNGGAMGMVPSPSPYNGPNSPVGYVMGPNGVPIPIGANGLPMNMSHPMSIQMGPQAGVVHGMGHQLNANVARNAKKGKKAPPVFTAEHIAAAKSTFPLPSTPLNATSRIPIPIDYNLVPDLAYLQQQYEIAAAAPPGSAQSSIILNMRPAQEAPHASPVVEALQKRADAILATILPSPAADAKRAKIEAYVRSLVRRALGSECFVTGSTATRLYLPDGDVDLTAILSVSIGGVNGVLSNSSSSSNGNVHFSSNGISGDPDWFVRVNEALCVASTAQAPLNHPGRPLTSSTTTHSVRNVSFINADVKLVRCLVDNVDVDISANQAVSLAGSALLESADRWIGGNHLLKRSILLVKAWIAHESACFNHTQQSLFSGSTSITPYTISLLMLSLFNSSRYCIKHPLQALLLFFEEFAEFPWGTQVVTINGPRRLYASPAVPPELARPAAPRYVSNDRIRAFRMFGATCSHRDDLTRKFDVRSMNVLDPVAHWRNAAKSVSLRSVQLLEETLRLGRDRLRLLFSRARVAQDNCMEFLSTLSGDTTKVAVPPHILPPAQGVLDGLFAKIRHWYGRGDGFREDTLNHPLEKGGAPERMQRLLHAPPLSDFALPHPLAYMGNAPLSTDPLAGDAEAINYALSYCAVFAGGSVSAPALASLVLQLLVTHGPMPVGEIGKGLQAITGINTLPLLIKEHYGGLKKFVEVYCHLFTVNKDHSFNPTVQLADSLVDK